METIRDVVSVQFVAACIGGALVMVEIFRQGGRYSVAKVCGVALASALLLILGSSSLGFGSPFLYAVALCLLSFFGGYLGGAALVSLYVAAMIGLAAMIIAVFHSWQWVGRKLRRAKARVVAR